MLRRWEDGKPRNYWDDDVHLRAALAWRLGRARLSAVEAALRQAGADSAGPVGALCRELDRPEHLPRLERWDAIGERTEDVAFHPDHHEIGRFVWRSGVLAVLREPGRVTEHVALSYLWALNGEAAHLCSIACTAGLIKAVQRAGTDWMRREWLPWLLASDYDRRWHGAQFLTEVQGGSDVGANTCVATPEPGRPGAWRVSGEKWFCSNVSADLYAVSARPQGAADGTRGLGLFVVPRRREDGGPNLAFARRLKQKLGTRTLPTAEMDFDGALAWQLGSLEDGFRLMMGVVVNTSRLAVATGASGAMRRAFVEALHYARVREAFGHRLIEFPAVRRQLADMRARAVAALTATLAMAAVEDRLTEAGVPPEADSLFRTGVILTKYLASLDAGRVVHDAIEILGGNGTIEDFSPLPRLWREAPVQESWEGPHNTLMAQLLRDAERAKMHDALFDRVEEALLAAGGPAGGAVVERALAARDELRERFVALLRGGGDRAALHVRPLAHRMGRLFQVALLLEQAAAAAEPRPLVAVAEWLLHAEVISGHDPADDPEYAARILAILAPEQ
ncbi:MAG TPA: acyl-CoA dehydrogenase family protein [Methylomirabilota bacterium]|nr:acyl-CoA dehydrogenase family protein [Methylomirabilota bacterium]